MGFFQSHVRWLYPPRTFDLDIKVNGDLQVDDHHTSEDTGIVLGTAIKEAVGDKKGIRRYGSCILPMDECLVLCAIDLGGRPYLSFEGAFTSEKNWRYVHRNGKGILLCHFLYGSHESSH